MPTILQHDETGRMLVLEEGAEIPHGYSEINRVVWACNVCGTVFYTEAEAAGCPCPGHAHARTRYSPSRFGKMNQEHEICPGCKQECDPEICWCGTEKATHDDYEEHSFVPMGCYCGRVRGPDRL
jgi:hypothetical protein